MFVSFSLLVERPRGRSCAYDAAAALDLSIGDVADAEASDFASNA
jgi:hypothetical protein